MNFIYLMITNLTLFRYELKKAMSVKHNSFQYVFIILIDKLLH